MCQDRVLPTERNSGKHLFNSSETKEELFWQIEEVPATEQAEPRSFQQAAHMAGREQFCICIYRASLHNRSGDRVVGIVFDDAAPSSGDQHSTDFLDQECPVVSMNVMKDANCRNKVN